MPVYSEEKNISIFIESVLKDTVIEGYDYEIIFCLDPSPDMTEEVISDLIKSNYRIKMLKFSRRVGQPMATLAGLEYSSGDAVIVMDVMIGGSGAICVRRIRECRPEC